MILIISILMLVNICGQLIDSKMYSPCWKWKHFSCIPTHNFPKWDIYWFTTKVSSISERRICHLYIGQKIVYVPKKIWCNSSLRSHFEVAMVDTSTINYSICPNMLTHTEIAILQSLYICIYRPRYILVNGLLYRKTHYKILLLLHYWWLNYYYQL